MTCTDEIAYDRVTMLRSKKMLGVSGLIDHHSDKGEETKHQRSRVSSHGLVVWLFWLFGCFWLSWCFVIFWVFLVVLFGCFWLWCLLVGRFWLFCLVVWLFRHQSCVPFCFQVVLGNIVWHLTNYWQH